MTDGSARVPYQIFSGCTDVVNGRTADIRAQAELTDNTGSNIGVGYIP
ncbi:MAG: hypothetical protein FWD69_12950 [Polyangiaceae bacterium]|nr:hypothetical protein [Polyangiaceae bacterium]